MECPRAGKESVIYGLRSLRRWFGRVITGLATLWLLHCLASEEGPKWVAAFAGVGALVAFYYLVSRIIGSIDEQT